MNPIHLSGPTARASGFRRAIAHGMWVTARALAALSGRLPDALTVDVGFREPLLLPRRPRHGAGGRRPGPRGALGDERRRPRRRRDRPPL
ncbi:MaoC/PaaZ C-terminal domain-containing protein [Geodermatophilus amargosae]|uniref:MaoC/PaaZ C-terminal domain-containing protein n=1 Tax=Geodermatophilus amargosae TaxID=1296565 RepID=UPI000A685975|nr:MaoC/PaaZ C-terminal domain-containing protein [Geodermatophilus amargosae]